ncbi:hypothetical protein BJ166DRAFT_588928 [Pestalotiopsis sp. NC0098]|nr:hypothetical protein BJ166DRAFT_588928 [Pestalotiopsis sp. NC0098]
MSPIASGSIVTFTNVGSGTCSTSLGAAISGWKCHGGANQNWRLQQVDKTGPWPVYMIQNQASGSSSFQATDVYGERNAKKIDYVAYMDLSYGGTTDGTPIVGWQGNATGPPNPHQRWRFITGDPHKGNVVVIQNIATGTVTDLYLGRRPNGTGVNGWTQSPDLSSGNTHQQWKVTVSVTPSAPA